MSEGKAYSRFLVREGCSAKLIFILRLEAWERASFAKCWGEGKHSKYWEQVQRPQSKKRLQLFEEQKRDTCE